MSDQDKWERLAEALTGLSQVMAQQVEMLRLLAESNMALVDALMAEDTEQAGDEEPAGVDMSGKRITLS